MRWASSILDAAACSTASFVSVRCFHSRLPWLRLTRARLSSPSFRHLIHNSHADLLHTLRSTVCRQHSPTDIPSLIQPPSPLRRPFRTGPPPPNGPRFEPSLADHSTHPPLACDLSWCRAHGPELLPKIFDYPRSYSDFVQLAFRPSS